VSWLLIRDAAAGGAWNMALDEALLEAATEGLMVLRLYAWDPPTLSFGRNEPALRRYDRGAIAARGIATVRRPTGGRAVWHHREVTYSVAAPLATFGSLRDTYAEIHSLLAQALERAGASVNLAPARPAGGVGDGACFASAAGGEVLAAGGAKVVGSAQVRRGNAFLQHGSILLTDEQEVVASVTRGAAARTTAAGLADLLGASATFELVADQVAAAAWERWGTAESRAAPGSVARHAASLVPGYADEHWTWRR
jgi:lipoate-protein ligase A